MKRRLILFIIAGVMTLAIPGCKNREAESPGSATSDETDSNKLREKGIPEEEFQYYKKRILSVLEIKKMFPVVDGVYYLADLSTQATDIEEEQRRNLMIKEYFFCKKYDEQIESKAKKIYEKQIETGIVAQYHCNFKLLESVADTYCKSVRIDS